MLLYCLIDNVFTNINDNSQSLSGILISNMSDHFPYFYSFKYNNDFKADKARYIYKRNFNDKNFNELYDKLYKIDFSKILNNNFKRIKFNKYKHKNSEWITDGIIRSIKFRDNLYKRVKQSSQNSLEYINLKHNLSVYNKIFKKSIKEAKFKYYNLYFERYQTNSQKTWEMIKNVT